MSAELPDVTVAAVDACSLPVWYPTFEKVTLKSVIIPLEAEVVAYLQGGASLVLPLPPDGVPLLPADPRAERPRVVDSDDDASGDEAPVAQPAPILPRPPSPNTDSASSSSSEAEPRVCFPALETAMLAAITSLGPVFPRLNWTSPQDAIWAAGTLKCDTPGDVFLLLKASDLVGVDLRHVYDECVDGVGAAPPCLVLRKWANLIPSREFRAFVWDRTLVGVCQRKCSERYEYLEEEMPSIVSLIVAFHIANIKPAFPLTHYVMDVYVDKKGRVWLLDFSVFGGTTSPLLFEWSEVATLGCGGAVASPVWSCVCEGGVVGRVQAEAGVRPSPLMHHQLPDDFFNHAAPGETPSVDDVVTRLMALTK